MGASQSPWTSWKGGFLGGRILMLKNQDIVFVGFSLVSWPYPCLWFSYSAVVKRTDQRGWNFVFDRVAMKMCQSCVGHRLLTWSCWHVYNPLKIGVLNLPETVHKNGWLVCQMDYQPIPFFISTIWLFIIFIDNGICVYGGHLHSTFLINIYNVYRYS